MKRYAQEAELKDIREALPEYEAIHFHMLQERARPGLDGRRRTRPSFERIKRGGEQGSPRFQGRNRWHSSALQRVQAMGPGWIMATWSCRRLGASLSTGLKALFGGRHQDGHDLQGGRRLVRLCCPVPRCPRQPFPAPRVGGRVLMLA